MDHRTEIFGDATLILGDCLEVMANMAPNGVDAVVTDPPYGEKETHSGHLSKITLRNGEPAGQALGFDGIGEGEMVELATLWAEIAKRWVVFTCEWKFVHALDAAGLLARFGIWRKPDGAPQFTGDRPGTGWEAVACCHRAGRKQWNGGGKHGFWIHPKGQNNSGHPTEKPLGLYTDFILDFTNPGETVLDPYMGSGTTGVACMNLGRKFIGIEDIPKYFDIACRRIDLAAKQERLPFEERAKPKQEPMEGI